MPKIANSEILGRPKFYGEPQYTQISAINMYKLIKVRHDIIIQWHRNNMEMKKINYMLEIDILRNSSQNILGVLRGAFKGLGVQKDTQTPYWLRP